MYSIIQPNFNICSAQSIKSGIEIFDAKLKVIDGKINSDFEKELDWAAKEAAWESGKGIFGSVLKGAVDILTFPANLVKNIVTGNPTAIFTDAWAIIDDVFAVGSNCVGLATLGLGYSISAITGSNEQKHLAITYSEAYGGVSGLTEALEAEETINGEGGIVSDMKFVSEKIDTASDAISLFNDAKGFIDDPSSMIDTKIGFKDKLSTLYKKDMIDEYQKDYHKWQALYRRLGKNSHYTELKNISNGYKYLQSFWDIRDGIDTFFENEIKTFVEGSNKWFKIFGDAYELGDDIFDYGKDIANVTF